MNIISVVLKKEQSQVALYDKKYNLLLKKDGTFSDISKLCLDTISEGGVTPTDVAYVGIAADSDFGVPDNIAAEVEKNIGIRCYGVSLINARALGEAYRTNDVPYLVMLKIDSAIECGIVINKKIYSGEHQLGGKIAHMVINAEGYECICGRRGCFEAYASTSGLKRIAAELGVASAESLTHAMLFDMNTPNAERAKNLYVKYLASGITNVINLFQPNELVLEGPFTEIGDELMTPMVDIVLREQYSHSMSNKCNIRISNNESDTALIGAALLGR